jgi:4-hydroxythreonine-4-phosphate dehydrogenase
LKPVIAITIGDFNGIGPEIGLKASIHPSVKKICSPVLVGPYEIFADTARRLKIRARLAKSSLPLLQRSILPVIDTGDGLLSDLECGRPTKSSGKTAGAALERAIELCISRKVSGMTTAPVSKEALNLAGYNFPGQTEMIALLSGSREVMMILVSDLMRVGLVTIHSGLKDVASQISMEKIREKVSIIDSSLKKDFLINNGKIAVLGLNPHNGENGIIGTEENQIIIPAISQSRSSGIDVYGPFSADSFFGRHEYKKYGAIVAMYHDQGLIPLKMSSFGRGVNYSAGLKIVRTSPDHGTAYDIAGKNRANISSMLEAIKLAVKISNNRQKL